MFVWIGEVVSSFIFLIVFGSFFLVLCLWSLFIFEEYIAPAFLAIVRTCSRLLRAATDSRQMEHRNRGLSGVNEDFEHCPTVNGIGAVNLKQVLRSIKNTITSDMPQLAENLSALQCEEGIKQFNLLERKIQSFKMVISAQLDANELTFIRYIDAIEQVYFEVLKNLQHFYLVMTSIETINERQLAARPRTKYVNNESEKEALQQRLDLWRSQRKIAEELLVQNEQMLTKLDLITSEIANIELNNMRTKSGVMEVAVTKMLDVNS